MRVVILGCGRTGAYLAVLLVKEGHHVTVIDQDRLALNRLGADFGGEVVVGLGIDEDVLHRAGIESAEAFIAVTDEDNTNVMVAQVARDIFGVPQVICRLYDPLRVELYRKLGLEIICPTLWGATRIKEFLGS